MDSTRAGDSLTPLADITNNINQGLMKHVSQLSIFLLAKSECVLVVLLGALDRNERRRQRYASMPKEQKDELNRKRRERRLENKRRANTTCDGSGTVYLK
jgi:hypothetical protein